MHYTLHQLEIFLKVNEKQSITKAAEDLHLSQPAVSIQLKKLQDQFDIPLTEVVGRQLYVTDFGKEIAIRAKRILDESKEIRYTADRYKGLLSGTISIAVVSTGKYVIPYFLKDFMDKHPGIQVSIDVSNKNQVMDGLSRNESDFSLVSVVPDEVSVTQVELMPNKLYLVGRVDYKDQIGAPTDLKDVPLLFREQGSATRNAMETYLKTKAVSAGKSMVLVSNEAIKQAIFAGLGVSVVPLIGLRTALQTEKIMLFELEDLPIVTQWRIIYSKNKKLTPAQQALVEFIEMNRERLIREHFHWAL